MCLWPLSNADTVYKHKWPHLKDIEFLLKELQFEYCTIRFIAIFIAQKLVDKL